MELFLPAASPRHRLRCGAGCCCEAQGWGQPPTQPGQVSSESFPLPRTLSWELPEQGPRGCSASLPGSQSLQVASRPVPVSQQGPALCTPWGVNQSVCWDCAGASAGGVLQTDPSPPRQLPAWPPLLLPLCLPAGVSGLPWGGAQPGRGTWETGLLTGAWPGLYTGYWRQNKLQAVQGSGH